MRSDLKTSTLALIAALLLTTGCIPDIKNLPSDKYAVKENRVLGDFYTENKETRRRTDCSITYTGNANFPYRIRSDNASASTTDMQLYSIGKTFFAFYRMKVGDKDRMVCSRVSISRTQLVFEPLKSDFFIKNPSALPGTKLIYDKSTRKANDVVIEATPDQLAAFLTLHAKSKNVFFTDEAMLLNRIP